MQRFQRDSGTISWSARWSGWRNRAVLLGMAAALIGVVLHAYVLTEAAGRWVRRAVLVGLLAVLAAGLWASPEASSAEALDFGDSPTAASVTSGDENRNVVKGAASPELMFDPSPRPTNFKVTPIPGGFTLSWDDADEHAGIEIVGWESHSAVIGWTPWERVSGHSVSDGTITLTVTHETDNRLNPYKSLRTVVAVRPIYANGQRVGHAYLEFDSIAIPRPE